MDYFTNQKLPVVAADCVVFMEEGVLLIRRRDKPGKGRLTVPGGMMEIDETVEEACKREMLEETGLKVDGLKLVGVFSDPNRDPRGRIISVVFLATEWSGEPRAGGDAAAIEIIKDWKNADLAFDHMEIVKMAETVKNKGNSC